MKTVFRTGVMEAMLCWSMCAIIVCWLASLAVIQLSHFIFINIVWGMEPVVTHQISWLESTGVCGVRQNQAGGSSVQKRA